jgi:hypothetical protein
MQFFKDCAEEQVVDEGMSELSDVQLALIGGGIAEVILG